MRADLIIVGAGMVGSALALALQDQGLEILLVDGSPLCCRASARALPTIPAPTMIRSARICIP